MDETRLLDGRPGEPAVFARRGATRWFIGAAFSGLAWTLSVPLGIQTGQWYVDLVGDGTDGLVRDPRVLRAGEALSVDIRAEGGFAAIACRWPAGITTCDEGCVQGA